jgi:hypothetical protein
MHALLRDSLACPSATEHFCWILPRLRLPRLRLTKCEATMATPDKLVVSPSKAYGYLFTRMRGELCVEVCGDAVRYKQDVAR